MRTILLAVALAGALAAARSTSLAAPDQTRVPGEMTQAKVWVQNRDHEAIPVDLRAQNSDLVLRVRVVNGDIRTPEPVLTRSVRPLWDYETVVVKTDADPVPLLNQRGMAGWETTGIAWTKPDGSTTLLLKRSR